MHADNKQSLKSSTQNSGEMRVVRPNYRKAFFANQMHREIFVLITGAALIPTLLMMYSVFFLIFKSAADQLRSPEVASYYLLPAAENVLSVLLLVVPVVIAGLLVMAHKVSHKIVGPFDRMIREMDDRILKRSKDPITLRPGDKFQPLVERINELLKR